MLYIFNDFDLHYFKKNHRITCLKAMQKFSVSTWITYFCNVYWTCSIKLIKAQNAWLPVKEETNSTEFYTYIYIYKSQQQLRQKNIYCSLNDLSWISCWTYYPSNLDFQGNQQLTKKKKPIGQNLRWLSQNFQLGISSFFFFYLLSSLNQ